MPDIRVIDAEVDRKLPASVRRAKLLRLALNGVQAARAAQLLGISAATAQREYRDPEFRRMALQKLEEAFANPDGRFEEFQLSLHDRIRLKSEEAFERLCEMLDDPEVHPAIRTRIAQDFLDRNPETLAGSVVHRGPALDPQQLSEAAAAAKEMDCVIPIRHAAG